MIEATWFSGSTKCSAPHKRAHQKHGTHPRSHLHGLCSANSSKHAKHKHTYQPATHLQITSAWRGSCIASSSSVASTYVCPLGVVAHRLLLTTLLLLLPKLSLLRSVRLLPAWLLSDTSCWAGAKGEGLGEFGREELGRSRPIRRGTTPQPTSCTWAHKDGGIEGPFMLLKQGQRVRWRNIVVCTQGGKRFGRRRRP